jgi:hypothetical protein
LAFNFILVILVAAVCCLAPLSAYLFWLAGVNRRPKPTVYSGRWDFVSLLIGLSGFVLFGGGLLLSLLQSNARFLTRGNFEAVRAAWGQDRAAWVVIVVVYLLAVVGGVLYTLKARRRSLVVYNIEPGVFEGVLVEVFDALGTPVERRGNLWVGGVPLFELEPFDAANTVTLRWVSDDDRLFQEVERQLREAVTGVAAPDNLAARWLASGAVGSMVVVVFCFILLLFSLNLVR